MISAKQGTICSLFFYVPARPVCRKQTGLLSILKKHYFTLPKLISMKHLLTICCFLFYITAFSQTKKTELYDLIKKLVQDSTIEPIVGDWAVGKPSAYPVQWQADRLEMSDDLTINFFRKGTANITVNGTPYTTGNAPMKWAVMLKGPRMGFTSFTITSGSHPSIKPKTNIDSLFAKQLYTFKLLKSCDKNPSAGFYFYEVHIPKKVTAWIKISWTCNGGLCALTLDCYDDWSKQYATLLCN